MRVESREPRAKSQGKVWLLAVVALLAFSFGPSAFGQTVQELQRQAQQNRALQQQQQARIERLNRDLANLDAATKGQLATLKGLEAELTRLERERAELTRQIELLDAQKRQAEANIASEEKKLAGLKERLSALLQSLHREKAGRYLPVLRAQSFTDLAVRADWVGVLGQHQTDLMDQINTTVRRLEDERIRLQLLLDDLAEKRQERQARIAEVGRTRVRVQATLTTLRTQSQGRQALLRESLLARSQLRTELRGLQGRIRSELARIARERAEAERKRREEEARLKREREREQAAQRERERQQRERENQRQQQVREQPREAVREAPAVPRELVGALRFPVQGGRVVEPYGSQGNDWQIIGAPEPNSGVVAAADGVVSGSVFVGNLGWILVIRHSERVSTIYSNILEPRVSEGQRVGQGQVIGFTGGGALIGPEQLIFQVGITEGSNEYFVDPSRYY